MGSGDHFHFNCIILYTDCSIAVDIHLHYKGKELILIVGSDE